MTAPWTQDEIDFVLLLASKCTPREICEGLAASKMPVRTPDEIVAKLVEIRTGKAA